MLELSAPQQEVIATSVKCPGEKEPFSLKNASAEVLSDCFPQLFNDGQQLHIFALRHLAIASFLGVA